MKNPLLIVYAFTVIVLFLAAMLLFDHSTITQMPLTLFLVGGAMSKNLLQEKTPVLSDPSIFQTSNEKFLLETQKKVLKALLPVIILTSIDKTGIISPTHMILELKKHYDTHISPGTIYTVFRKLQQDGNIQKHQNQKYYTLTPKGQDALMKCQKNAKLIMSAANATMP
jgi:predicted transcriptional regulator